MPTKNSRNSCREATRDGTRHVSRGKGDHSPFKTSKEGSLLILANLVWKVEKSDCIDECNAVIQEQLQAGIVERAPPTVEGREFYIPHFTLINFIALFVLGIRLTVGKVTLIIRTLKASTSFPILHVDQDNLKLPGIIKVRGILVFN